MRTHLIAGSLLLLASPAHAQRDAISPDISPEIAGRAFEDAVMNACLPAVSGGQRVGQMPAARAMLAESSDPETRRQIGAGPGETVWDVTAGRGVVEIKESAGRCTVSVYGPRAQPAMSALSAKLVAAGFTRMAAPAVGLRQMLTRTSGQRVQAIITGSEPGSPGHQSRFAVVTATLIAQ
jgi:hypothetical protein